MKGENENTNKSDVRETRTPGLVGEPEITKKLYFSHAENAFYIFLEGNTYPIKDKLKEHGFKWNIPFMRVWGKKVSKEEVLEELNKTQETLIIEKDEIINIKNGFLNSNNKITKENLKKLKEIIKKAKNYDEIKEYFENIHLRRLEVE